MFSGLNEFKYLNKVFGPGLCAATRIKKIVIHHSYITWLHHTVCWISYILYMHKNNLHKLKMRGFPNDLVDEGS